MSLFNSKKETPLKAMLKEICLAVKPLLNKKICCTWGGDSTSEKCIVLAGNSFFGESVMEVHYTTRTKTIVICVEKTGRQADIIYNKTKEIVEKYKNQLEGISSIEIKKYTS